MKIRNMLERAKILLNDTETTLTQKKKKSIFHIHHTTSEHADFKRIHSEFNMIPTKNIGNTHEPLENSTFHYYLL
jgi:hypothetical protein